MIIFTPPPVELTIAILEGGFVCLAAIFGAGIASGNTDKKAKGKTKKKAKKNKD